MSEIKTYEHIYADTHQLSFNVKRMEDIYEQRAGVSDEPHRHDYFTILLVNHAKGTHIIDFQKFDLQPLQVYFISPGQVHQIQEREKSFGYVFTFTPQFMMENGIENCFIEDLHLFHHVGYAPPLEISDSEYQKLSYIAEDIYSIFSSNQKFRYQAIGALLKLFLIYCNNVCSLSEEENTQSLQASAILLRDFKTLLNQKYKEWHKVASYAGHLHITADYLNASVKSLSGKSAKEHIQSRRLLAAKRYLVYSPLNNKEIAYELGFSEPANFSQFFKKHTQMSPSEFRKLH